MENTVTNGKKKWSKIVAILIAILAILIALSVLLFATEDQEEVQENVVLDVAWRSGADEYGTLEAFTGSSYAIDWNLKFNNIPTGFQDVELSITNLAGTPIANLNTANNSEAVSIQNGQYSRVDLGSKNTGKEFGGSTTVTFGAASDLYEKDIVITVTGTYKDGGETVNFSVQKVLKANVTPKTEKTDFVADIEMQKKSNGQTISESVTSNMISMGRSQYGRDLGYYATNVTAIYPIHINSYKYTQNLKLEVTINRTVSDESKLSDGYTINWGGLDTELGTPTERTNDDGSITYTFTKGEEGTTLNEETAFSIDKNFTVTIKYDVPNSNPEFGGELKEANAVCTFNATLESTGYEKVKEYGKDEVIEQKSKVSSLNKRNFVTLYEYTPGNNAWIKIFLDVFNSAYLEEEQMNEFIENGSIDLKFYTEIDNSCNWGEAQENAIAYINYSQPVITYLSDEGTIETMELTPAQMKLASVKGDYNKEVGNLQYTGLEDTISLTNNEYQLQDNVNEFNIQLNDFLSTTTAITKFRGYITTYTLYANELGLSQTELKNIITISVRMTTSGNRWCQGGGDGSYYNTNSLGNKYSYMKLEVVGDNFNTDTSNKNVTEEKTLKLRMYKNTDVIKTEQFSVYNENPVFYVSLPSQFAFTIKKIEITDSPYITINNEKTEIVYASNGEKYLKIVCDGTYDSKKQDEVDITITVNRTLISRATGNNNKLTADMITENERYYNEATNGFRFENLDGSIPEKVFRSTVSYNITGSTSIAATTSVSRNDGKNITYEPDPANSTIEYAEKEQPVLIDSNSSVIYKSEINATGESLTNVSIISRLPIANNTYINNASSQLIESDYELPDSFYENFGEKVKDFEQGDIISQVSLTNIQNIKVYLNDTQEVASNQYKLYYSNDAVADFSTENFIEYTEGADLSNAKNLKVVFNENVILYSGSKYSLQYEMTMPNTKGMVGAATAVEYTKVSDSSETTLYSPAAYVINGNTSADLTITKQFEGYGIGVAPSGISLSGIEFKLKYYDKTSGEMKFLKDSNDDDIVATTNDNGIAKFENIPYGEYFIYEVTEFNNYDSVRGSAIVYLAAGENQTFLAVQPTKKGEIDITKVWYGVGEQDTQKREATFKVTRTNNDNISYTKTVSIDEDNKAVLTGVPYGTYTITETSCTNGWITTGSQTVTLDSEKVTATMVNRPSSSVIQIVKNVPDGETVDGLTFHVSGFGVMTYIDTNGNEVTNNKEYTITIGANSYPSGVSVSKTNSDKTATITISGLPLGLYTIEEIDIPLIEGTQIEKYVSVYRTMNLTTDISITGKPEVINISNRYKYGTIEINKTAKLKEGNEYTDIGDLSGFQVLISGTSYYGTNVNKVIKLDENGIGRAKLEIGEYTLREINVDGYTTYYGANSESPTELPTVTIEYGKTIKQDLYNEHTGIGFVRVEKSLEGVSDPQTVVDKGIRFNVVGQNVAGGRVNETIVINSIDEEKNVAYGISGPISSGGEYELIEDEASVPDFFEPIEPMEIDLKSSYSQTEPLVIEALNPRTKGDLEIITETIPEGGPLTGITYRVTEVTINENGTYTKIGDPVNLDGSNDTINASYAELKQIDAGYYLVEQTAVPEGWDADVPQVVEVPSYNTGYANFEITKKPVLASNKLTIKKVVLNKENEVATDEDYEKAKLNKGESFEIKLTNIMTGENYYVFTSSEKSGVIQGLDAGTYRIEEVYKPKYLTEGYYKDVEIEPSIDEAEGQEIESTIVEQKIEEKDGVYLFTIGEENDLAEDVTITVKNKINTNFGFGGKTSRDNLSKTDVEEEQLAVITKAVIYVVDENNKAISGVKFNLIDSNGNTVSLNDRGTDFEVPNKKLTIRGLNTGTYTLKCVEVPDGYLVPDDKQVIVFSDATQVAHVEVQKNVPRGSMTLSTVYTTDEGETKYTSRSKYKVVDTETGELVKFVRTATGDYKKSNLSTASPVIVLKSGPVEVEGIETGKYEVGIVDVTRGYGIISTKPETVRIKQDENTNVSVEVNSKKIAQVQTGYYTSMFLDENGDLYAIGNSSQYGLLGDGVYNSVSAQFKKVEFSDDSKISKISFNNQSVLALDTEGRIWSWGYGGNGITGTTENYYSPTLIGTVGSGIKDISISSETGLLLDNDGNVWATGYYIGDGTSDKNANLSNPVLELYHNGIKVKELAQMRGYSCNAGVIDTDGKIWMWGPGSSTRPDSVTQSEFFKPVCISDIYSLEDVNFEKLLLTDTYAMAIDDEGNLWAWGTSGIIQGSLVQGVTKVPKQANSGYFKGNRVVDFTGIGASSGNYDFVAVLDEKGNVYTWGYGMSGQLGTGYNSATGVPACISDIGTSPIYGLEIKNISMNYSTSTNSSSDNPHIIAVDANNRIWGWGGYSRYGETGQLSSSGITLPQEMPYSYNEHLEYNLKFKEVFVSYTGGTSSFAVDEEGKLWAWGNNSYGELGLASDGNDILIPTEVDIAGDPKIKKVSSAMYATVILSEDGIVYKCGADGSYNRTRITDVTSLFGVDNEEKIVDVGMLYNKNVIACDSQGKVYIMDTSNNVTCLSDTIDELKDAIITKFALSSYGNGTAIALASDGTAYYITSNSASVLSDETKFVDIENIYLLDSEGKLWTDQSGTAEDLNCVVDNPSNPLYKYYQKDPNYKIVKIYNATYNSTNSAILKDSNGQLWGYLYNTNSVYKLEGTVSLNRSINADAMPKEFISLAGYLLVDKYGQIWVYQNVGNYDGEAGNGTTSSITNPICLTTGETNVVYNVKMKRIISDYLVVGEKGKLYTYSGDTSSSVVRLNGISPIDYMEDYLGINIVDKIEDAQYSTIEAVAIDENGKIWQGNTSGVTCLSDLEETELAQAHSEDSNLRFEKIFEYSGANGIRSWYAIDNYGNVWSWGTNASGQLGNGNTTNTTSPSKIENLSNVESLTMVSPSSTSSPSVIAKTSNGNIYLWGNNYNGQLGDGTKNNITTPYCVNNHYLDGKEIKTIEIAGTYYYGDTCTGIILCTDGSIYVAGPGIYDGSNEWKYVGNCEGAEKIAVAYSYINRAIGYRYIVIGENKTWCFGYNGGTNGYCGTGDITSSIITTPTLISEEFTVEKVLGTDAVLDNNGNVWRWGPETPYKVNSDEIKILDKYANGYITSEGVYLTALYSTDSGYSETDLSEYITAIYGELNEENIKEFANSGTMILKNGKLWTTNDYKTWTCMNNIETGDLYGKTVVSASDHKAIDSEGKLYVWEQYTGFPDTISVPTCATNIQLYTTPTFKANNTVINVPEGNGLYGVKVKELINDKFVVDENNNIWYFTENGKATNLSTQYVGDTNPLYGKTITKVLATNYVIADDNNVYYMGSDYPGVVMEAVDNECEYITFNCNNLGYEYYVALDKDGKIWVAGKDYFGYGILGTGTFDTKGKAVCLNDIEETALYEAAQEESNFKIEKIVSTTSSVIAIDNSGRIWGWGQGSEIGSGSSSSVLTPICISDIESTELYNAYQQDSNFKIEDVSTTSIRPVFRTITDSDGYIWWINTSTYKWEKWQGNGDLASAFADENFRISKISSKGIEEYYRGYIVLGNDGKAYYNSGLSYGYANYTLISNVTGIKDITIGTYSTSSSTTRQSYTSIWYAYTGDGVYSITGTYLRTRPNSYSSSWTNSCTLSARKISTVVAEKIYDGYIIDADGKVWQVTNLVGAVACLSDDTSKAYYGKQIESVTTITGTKVFKDTDGTYYTPDGVVYEGSTTYDEIVERIYGDTTIDHRNAVYEEITNNYNCIKIDGTCYKVTTSGTNVTLEKIGNVSSEYINGAGKIVRVVGEDEVQSEDGTIYKITSTDGSTISIEKTTEVTEFETYEITPIEIEDVNIVKQTRYKALDDEGNLYVWDSYTGLAEDYDGIVCLNTQEYYIEPVYLRANGWSVIKAQN